MRTYWISLSFGNRFINGCDSVLIPRRSAPEHDPDLTNSPSTSCASAAKPESSAQRNHHHYKFQVMPNSLHSTRNVGIFF
ncbi:hypothetical protein M413DRAFT_233221 [Hebeloma cylindrosporum]|uniref:Uncharacterized protein n=1 Tax=Hebeloma cylindrosporum TaxID=76867 RepID=A0A0C2XMN5_HEBCY|nr:hypothetical protein M413DRAFT_233221 [Hebeloma cylindrosporum h7]